MSDEAAQTGNRANEVRELSGNVASGVDRLRDIPIRTVRTAAA